MVGTQPCATREIVKGMMVGCAPCGCYMCLICAESWCQCRVAPCPQGLCHATELAPGCHLLSSW